MARQSRPLALGAWIVGPSTWLAPLPVADVVREASVTGRVLVADEIGRTGGVSESVIAALADCGCSGRIARVASEDSFNRPGHAAKTVLPSARPIATAAQDLTMSRRT